MAKKCLDCTSNAIDDLESDMDHEIPMWYKKAGNYSRLPKLLNREDKFNPNKTKLKEDPPEISEIEVRIPVEVEVYEKNGKKEGTWIFYWAALSNKEIEINGPEAAYGDESNSGVTKSDKEGKAELVLNCPQPYRVEGISYPRHVHYTTVTKDNVWSLEVKTHVVYCHLDKEQFTKALKSKDHIIINALSEEDHNEKSIPETLNLPVGNLNKNNRGEKVQAFIEHNLKKYPDLEDLIDEDKISIKDVPIITYCADESCNASKNLANHIMNAGFSNVVEYPGGIKEWFDEKGDSDETSDEEDGFFNDTDKYNLEEEYETIIINNIKYKHKLDDLNYIFDENDNKVGELIDKKVVWDTEQDKKNNEIMIETTDEEEDEDDEKTKSIMDKINGKKEEQEEQSEDEDEQEEQSEESEDEDEDEQAEQSEDEDEQEEQSEDEDEDKDEDKGEKDKKGGDKKTSSLAYDGIYLCAGGSELITQKRYDNLFRGWGFSFI